MILRSVHELVACTTTTTGPATNSRWSIWTCRRLPDVVNDRAPDRPWIREVAEESGITIEVTAVCGVYSDPSHVLVDPDASIHQQLAPCFHAVLADPEGGPPLPDGIEIDAARWCCR